VYVFKLKPPKPAECASGDVEDEVLADTALARWWKKTGRTLLAGTHLPNTDNPNTLINYIAK